MTFCITGKKSIDYNSWEISEAAAYLPGWAGRKDAGRSKWSGRSHLINYPAVVILVLFILLIQFCISDFHLGRKGNNIQDI